MISGSVGFRPNREGEALSRRAKRFVKWGRLAGQPVLAKGDYVTELQGWIVIALLVLVVCSQWRIARWDHDIRRIGRTDYSN
ncbi:MAG: hypothetical protein ABL962_17075 [Fimbriimonadaceae bacterium]